MKKSITALFMILLVLFLNLPVQGSLPQGSSQSSRAQILIIPVDGKEYSPELLFSEELRDCLQSVNFPSDHVLKAEASEDGFILRVSEDVSLHVDLKGILTGITNWANDKALSGTHAVPTQGSIQSWETRIRTLFHLDASYELTTSREWDEDYYEFRFQKRDESGILSDYDSAKAYIAMADGTAASCGFFYTESVSRRVLISEADARERAEAFFRKTYGFMDCEADKGATFSYHTPGRDSEWEENQNDVRYCYCVTFGDGSWMVFVDTETGKIVAVDGWQSERLHPLVQLQTILLIYGDMMLLKTPMLECTLLAM